MRCDLDHVPTTRRGDRPAFPTVGDLFQSFFSPAFSEAHSGMTMPALDLKEDADHYAVVVDVPGYTMDHINVQFAENVLTLSGERAEQVAETSSAKKSDAARWHIVERTSGSFSRSIKFPVPVDAVNVKASLKGGVLTVTVPKGAEARPQKIKITEA